MIIPVDPNLSIENPLLHCCIEKTWGSCTFYPLKRDEPTMIEAAQLQPGVRRCGAIPMWLQPKMMRSETQPVMAMVDVDIGH